MGAPGETPGPYDPSTAQAGSGKQAFDFADCILGCTDHIFLSKRHLPRLLTTLPFCFIPVSRVFAMRVDPAMIFGISAMFSTAGIAAASLSQRYQI